MTEIKFDPPEALTQLVVDELEALKALEIKVINVQGRTTITDVMIIATGTSTRHVKALATAVATKAKEEGIIPLGTEGEQSLEWMLVDLNDVVVHVMLQEMRDFYNLEKLWEVSPEPDEDALAQQQ